MGKAPKYTKRDIDGVIEILRGDEVIAIVMDREDADTILMLLNNFLGDNDGRNTRKGRRSTDSSD